MTEALSPARARAISQLQKIRDRRLPYSFEWAVADHAIDLVLSPGRPEGDYLVRNALRNARSILAVQKRRNAKRGMVPLYGDSDGLDVASEIEFDHTYRAAAPIDPERNLVAKQAVAALGRACEGLGRYGRAVLDGWFVGDEIKDTATAAGISVPYVKKLRSGIRGTAVSLA